MPATYYVDGAGVKRPLLVTHNHDQVYAPAVHTHFKDDTGWIDLPLINDWFNYGNWATAGYRRLHGVVYLKGLIRRTASVPASGSDAGAVNVVGFLPGGFRPLEKHIVLSTNQHTPSHYNFGQRIDIGPDGEIHPLYYNDRDGDTWTSLSGISFLAEQ